MYDDYNNRLLSYITDYVRENGVPPTVDLMIENVKGKSSKSTVHARLKKMVSAGLLVQKNQKGYYYPTTIDVEEVFIPKFLLEQACTELDNSNQGLSNLLRKYL